MGGAGVYIKVFFCLHEVCGKKKVTTVFTSTQDWWTSYPTICLFCFVSVEIERLMFSVKNQFFFHRIDLLETSPCELSSAVKKNE